VIQRSGVDEKRNDRKNAFNYIKADFPQFTPEVLLKFKVFFRNVERAQEYIDLRDDDDDLRKVWVDHVLKNEIVMGGKDGAMAFSQSAPSENSMIDPELLNTAGSLYDSFEN
jgi:hypothetical protein